MTKPSTEGCTEWSCMYHGRDNQAKAKHAEGCPTRESKDFLDPSRCTCGVGSDDER